MQLSTKPFHPLCPLNIKDDNSSKVAGWKCKADEIRLCAITSGGTFKKDYFL